ncbi:unnamed protein product [Cylindrotheca closterium]|uniref:Uncharacterized protein n=1 Tax=Cylindrotheca closterium TaxID=2856 RepID=A0AAD2CKQ0_9STRA|nr:unnamed protein product [Cylindrotheca closterium]
MSPKPASSAATTAIVHYFFQAGVQLVAITAEPGGSDAVRQRLLEREVSKLDYEIRSDPEHSFLTSGPPTPPKDLFIMKDHQWEVSGDYKMVQPALVVYDADKEVISETTWSWKTMGLDDNNTNWDSRVDTQAWEGEADKKVLLVTMRPVMSDLLAAIQEKRAVKLASTHKQW